MSATEYTGCECDAPVENGTCSECGTVLDAHEWEAENGSTGGRTMSGLTVDRLEEVCHEVMRCLGYSDGDDLERARAAFRNLSEDEMDLEHGMSGKTRREILTGYEQHRERSRRLAADVQAVFDAAKARA